MPTAKEVAATKPRRTEYTLRKGYTIWIGDTRVDGPDTIPLTLQQAYEHRHMLEEHEQIVEAAKAFKRARAEKSRDADAAKVAAKRAEAAASGG